MVEAQETNEDLESVVGGPPAGIRLSGVSLERDGVEVFANLSLTLTERRIGLIGNNGSGKSSLLRLFNGLLRPGRGTVLVHGHDPVKQAEAMAEVVGFIFQNPDHQLIFPTVLEELGFGLRNLGYTRQAAKEAALALLARHGKSEWAQRSVHTLSDGQKQLVCILAVLLMQPKVLVLDEPFSALDLPTRQGIMRLLAELPQQVIMVSHELESLQDFDRVVWLDQGRVHQDGAPGEVLSAYLRQGL
jgi:biotin transport system ATP-binding protein